MSKEVQKKRKETAMEAKRGLRKKKNQCNSLWVYSNNKGSGAVNLFAFA